MFIAGVGLAALLLVPAIGHAQSLGSAASFAILAGTTVTNTGNTQVLGSIGVSPGSGVTGFPPGTLITGSIHDNDGVAAQAQTDLTAAYNSLAGMACGTNLSGQDLGGMTLTPGVYCFNTSAGLTGILTLDAQNNPDAVFVFQIGSTLTTAMNGLVNAINSAQNTNVYWQVGSSATLGSGTVFVGNIVALASITLTTAATVSGRTLARTGAVTLDTNFVGDSTTPTLPSSWGTLKVLYR
jgi:type VI secretion system secreted protein VgrG